MSTDPTLQAQQEAAIKLRQDTTQAGLSDETLNNLRIYGARQNLAGVAIGTPMRSLVGPR